MDAVGGLFYAGVLGMSKKWNNTEDEGQENSFHQIIIVARDYIPASFLEPEKTDDFSIKDLHEVGKEKKTR
ncbi:hypothetical protein [Salinimicrobium flavum]|uniref:Uncharacterized protein n=1 Tax=Salinimicrobium flavum TaxID=1737065 RepID=A0ABW5IZI2_9FLAO